MSIGDSDDFEMYSGDARSITYSIVDGDDDEGPARNITGASFQWMLADFEGGPAILDKNTEDSPSRISILSAPDGQVQLEIASGEITRPGTYWHNLVMTLAGVVETVSVGKLVVIPRAA